MVHHGDKKIKEDDDVYEREASEHDESPKPCELFNTSQFKIIEINETECCPEQGLWGLPQTEIAFWL